jgi:hypothetical protein
MPRTATKPAQAAGDKEAKFRKLAQARTAKALDVLDVLGNCFNRANYSYTDEQVEKIMGALEGKLAHLRDLTNPEVRRTDNSFTL